MIIKAKDNIGDFSLHCLGMGLSIILKAGVELLRWLWGAIAKWSEHLQLKKEALGLIFWRLP